MLKKVIPLSLVAVLTIATASCGGGGGGGTPEPLVEGDGPALDITKVSDLEALVEAIVFRAIYPPMQAFGDLSPEKEQEALQALCSSKSYSETINPTEVEEGVSMGGTFNISAPPDFSTVNASKKVNSNCANYGYEVASLAKALMLTGKSNYSSVMNISGSNIIQQICTGQADENGTSTNKMTENADGNISISGDIGGAISFELNEITVFSSGSENDGPSISFSGSATILSGGETATCVLGYSNEEFKYTVSCE